MDIENVNGFSLKNLGDINVILGKNGCGKSYLLKRIEVGLRGNGDYGTVRYVSPERGGTLNYEPGVEQNITNDPNWIRGERQQNQARAFRQQSTALFRLLELKVLWSIEEDHGKPGYERRTFDKTVELLNSLLDRVKLVRDRGRAFRIVVKKANMSLILRRILAVVRQNPSRSG